MSLKLDPRTGDYVMDGGKPVTDDTLLTPAYIRIKAQRENWLYAPNKAYGSLYYKSHARIRDVVVVEEIGRKALQPLVDDGRAESVTVVADAVARGAVGLKTIIVDNRGKPEILDFNPIGDD